MKMNFTVTEAAIRRIVYLVSLAKAEQQDIGFRIAVEGGGCSGFQYKFDYKAKKLDEDFIYPSSEVEIYIDPTSLSFLEGCSLDYTEDLGGARFEVKNPHATAKCGCGKSFAV